MHFTLRKSITFVEKLCPAYQNKMEVDPQNQSEDTVMVSLRFPAYSWYNSFGVSYR